MAISFAGAKKYKKHNGILSEIKAPIPSPVHFYSVSGLQPLVNIGDKVICGQKIADIDSFELNPVLSGCSGTVIAAGEDIIEVENDMFYMALPPVKPAKKYDELTTREILWLLREGGVFEERCNAPLHVLLSEKNVRDCIIVCCFDSDPYVSSPQAAAFGNSGKIKDALDLCMRLSGITKAYVAVENDTKKTFADFKALLRYNESVTPFLLKARYPQSRDDVLIKTITGNENTNALILSPETLVNMIDVLETGSTVTKKIVTVSGDDILEPENFSVPIGATAASIIESGGYSSPEALISGGVIDGVRITDFDTPVTPQTKALIAFHEQKNIPRYRKNLI